MSVWFYVVFVAATPIEEVKKIKSKEEADLLGWKVKPIPSPWMIRVTIIPARGVVPEKLHTEAAPATHREKPTHMTSPYLFNLDMY